MGSITVGGKTYRNRGEMLMDLGKRERPTTTTTKPPAKTPKKVRNLPLPITKPKPSTSTTTMPSRRKERIPAKPYGSNVPKKPTTTTTSTKTTADVFGGIAGSAGSRQSQLDMIMADPAVSGVKKKKK
jgi:hypothetical protein